MKPYVVTQAAIDVLDSNLAAMDDDMDSALDRVVFNLFPDGAPADMWPEGVTEADVAKLVENPVMSLSLAVRQLEEVIAGIAGRMTFAFYRLQLDKAVKAESGTDATLFSTVVKSMKDWMQANLLSAANQPHGAFFTHFHNSVIANAARLVATLEGNERSWTRTQELCDKYGIDFAAIEAEDTTALGALEVAGVKEMPVEALVQYVFMTQGDPNANQDAVTVAKDRLAAAQAAAAGAQDGTPALASGGSFKPNFGSAELEDSIRA